MPSFMTYAMAGGLVLLAADFAAPASGVGMPRLSWPVIEQNAERQFVNRIGKGDRLPLQVVNKPSIQPRPATKIPAGCEPVFSPLSAAAQLNFAGRCVA